MAAEVRAVSILFEGRLSQAVLLSGRCYTDIQAVKAFDLDGAAAGHDL